MQQSFVSNAVDVNLLDIDLTGKTQDQLAELAQQALGESLNLARRSVESAWFAGKVLERAKQNTKHGQWGAWLESHGFSPDIVERVRKLYREYEIPQIAEFTSVDAALRAIPKKYHIPIPEPEPQPEQQASTTPVSTGGGALKDGKTPPTPSSAQPDPATREPLTAIDTVTGKEAEWAEDHQPTATEQIYAHEGRTQPLDTSGGVHKEREKVEEWQPKTHRLAYRKGKQGIPLEFDIALGDEVIITGKELFYLKQGALLVNPPKDSVAFHKGDVI